MAFTAALVAREDFEVQCRHHLLAARSAGRLVLHVGVALLVTRRVFDEKLFPGTAGAPAAWARLPLQRQRHLMRQLLVLFVPPSERGASDTAQASLRVLLLALLGAAATPSEWMICAAASSYRSARMAAWITALSKDPGPTAESEAAETATRCPGTAPVIPLVLARRDPWIMKATPVQVTPLACSPVARFLCDLGVPLATAVRFVHHGNVEALHAALVTAGSDAASPRRLARGVGAVRAAAELLDAITRAACAAIHADGTCAFSPQPARAVPSASTPEVIDALLRRTVARGLREHTECP